MKMYQENNKTKFKNIIFVDLEMDFFPGRCQRLESCIFVNVNITNIDFANAYSLIIKDCVFIDSSISLIGHKTKASLTDVAFKKFGQIIVNELKEPYDCNELYNLEILNNGKKGLFTTQSNFNLKND